MQNENTTPDNIETPNQVIEPASVITPTAGVMSPAAPIQNINDFTQPSTSHNTGIQVGVSASQLGLQQVSGNKSNFSIKKLVVGLLIIVAIVSAAVAVLSATNVIALTRFKTVDYTNAAGTQFKLKFYSKHSTKILASGSKSLISEVSNDGKFPVTLSIVTRQQSSYAKVKGCSGSGFSKEFDVQNSYLNQTISVCSVSAGAGNPRGVYVAGVLYNNHTDIITISQDLSSLDLTSKTAAQQALLKFGLDVYQDDIKTILSSLKIK